MEFAWELPPLARFLDRLASFARLIVFDKRGTGPSTVKDLVVGADLAFADRGATTLKGLPGEWRLYAVSGRPMSTGFRRS